MVQSADPIDNPVTGNFAAVDYNRQTISRSGHITYDLPRTVFNADCDWLSLFFFDCMTNFNGLAIECDNGRGQNRGVTYVGRTTHIHRATSAKCDLETPVNREI